MANSKFEYVRKFELPDSCLPNVWMVVRIDGKGFHKFADAHEYQKPNDDRGLNLMNFCAQQTMNEFKDITMAYGESDEYSFILRKDTTLFNRRASKISTNIVSFFSSCFVFYWTKFFGTYELKYPPTFDARVVCYPSEKNLRDYLSWRQADCHINNLYNTCFWALVHSGQTNKEAEDTLKGTFAADKNELLFTRFGINYNTVSDMYKKGSFIYWSEVEETIVRMTPKGHGDSTMVEREFVRKRRQPTFFFGDIISDTFWSDHPQLLAV
eukprot:Colp12_sorted_trinity150504_noHs@18769